MKRENLKTAAIFLLIFVTAIFYPLLYLQKYGNATVFSFLANDTFYYLSIARNSIGVDFYSFDGSFPTNGFHPAWQYLLHILLKNGLLGNDEEVLRRVYIVSVVLVGASVSIFWLAVKNTSKFSFLALPMLVPGLSWILLSPLAPDYLSSYSFQNGMESPLALLFFSLALFFAISKTWQNVVWATLFLTVSVLSRLDDVFILGSVLVFFLLNNKNYRERPVTSFLLIVIPVVVFMTYLTYNKITVNAFMPLSGAEKFSWTAITSNLKIFVWSFVPISPVDLPLYHTDRILGFSIYSEIFMRNFQMIYPAAMCGLYLLAQRKGYFKEMPRVFVFVAIGIIIKVAYNFIFVSLWHQGHWYFANSIFFSNFLGMLFFAAAINRIFDKAIKARASYIAVALAVLTTAYLSNAFFNWKSNAYFGSSARGIYENRYEIISMLNKTGITKFIEFDDGIIGWSTGIPATSGLGLALDKQATAARKNGIFLKLMKERGYQYGVAGGDYADFLKSQLSKNNGDLRVDLWGIKKIEFEKYSFEIVKFSNWPKFLVFKIVEK